MRKILKIVCTSLFLLAFLWLLSVAADRQALRTDLIRLHVVGASDSEADQRVKLQVRDAIMTALQEDMAKHTDGAQARAWLQENLDRVTELSNKALEDAGFSDRVTVSLTEEAFPVRHYDTFSLPSGVYSSLRVTIGAGEGKNWWCVVFPSLCLPAAGEDFQDTAAGAGFSDGLSSTLEGEKPYQVRFYLLDLLGKIQNFFFQLG